MEASLQEIHRELGITAELLSSYKLPFHEQPALSALEVVDIDLEGRPFIMLSSAAKAWRAMTSASVGEGVLLAPFSGFRSYIHQKNLIEKHLKNGRRLEDILTHIAIPGYSEHHSGRAADIHTDGKFVLEEAFEETDAFAWLSREALRFGFRMTYPRGNDQGIIYEPWHWCFHE